MYDIAVSFAGEDRKIVEKISNILSDKGHKIFYDKYEEALLWGRDLTKELPAKYRNARYVMVFISDYYLKKMWTNYERQIIIQKHIELKGEQFLLPVRLNGCKKELPGLSQLVSYISLDSKDELSIKDLCNNLESVLK